MLCASQASQLSRTPRERAPLRAGRGFSSPPGANLGSRRAARSPRGPQCTARQPTWRGALIRGPKPKGAPGATERRLRRGSEHIQSCPTLRTLDAAGGIQRRALRAPARRPRAEPGWAALPPHRRAGSPSSLCTAKHPSSDQPLVPQRRRWEPLGLRRAPPRVKLHQRCARAPFSAGPAGPPMKKNVPRLRLVNRRRTQS